MRFLKGTRPQLRERRVPILPMEFQVLLSPGLKKQLLGFGDSVEALVDGRPKAGVLPEASAGPSSSPHQQPPVAQVVQKRGLHRQTDRMVERNLDDRKANPDALCALGERRPEDDWIGKHFGAPKVMLAEPHDIVAEFVRENGFAKRPVDDLSVPVWVRVVLKHKRAESHPRTPCSGAPPMSAQYSREEGRRIAPNRPYAIVTRNPFKEPARSLYSSPSGDLCKTDWGPGGGSGGGIHLNLSPSGGD